jgi:hypothetical protein
VTNVQTEAQERLSRAMARTTTVEQLKLLPVTVPVVEAGRAFGLSRDGTYDLLGRGEFPCRTIRVGRATKVPRAELLRVLGISEETVATG